MIGCHNVNVIINCNCSLGCHSWCYGVFVVDLYTRFDYDIYVFLDLKLLNLHFLFFFFLVKKIDYKDR